MSEKWIVYIIIFLHNMTAIVGITGRYHVPCGASDVRILPSPLAEAVTHGVVSVWPRLYCVVSAGARPTRIRNNSIVRCIHDYL